PAAQAPQGHQEEARPKGS
ncbi:unnamed protein product, partial [Oikopleura dioica]